MPEEIIGWIDNLGYLFCYTCVIEVEKITPVHRGSHPHGFEHCDRCKRRLDRDREYVPQWGVAGE